jgi:hypothetical protein
MHAKLLLLLTPLAASAPSRYQIFSLCTKRFDKSFDSTTSLRCQETATFNLAVGMIAPDRPMLRSIASSTVTASIAAN